jgi:acetyl esterase/lipase
LKDDFAVLSFEIPGTGDCPASKSDPLSPDRIMSSVIDWVHANAPKYNFDVSKICARGISTGGYYAIRAAHTHADRLFAVVAQGGGSHRMFDAEWIADQDRMEYPYALTEALAFKFGYESVEAYAKDSNARKRYSPLEGDGRVLDKESCPMLVINGMEDSIFPIEDSILVAMKGRNKELLCRANLRHMGNPGGEEIVSEWLLKKLAVKP